MEPYSTGILATFKNKWNSSNPQTKCFLTTLAIPIYLLHIISNILAMIIGIIFQHSSIIDFTWGIIGTGIGLIFGFAQILFGNKVDIINGTTIFKNSNLMIKNTGVSLGPVLSAGKTTIPGIPEFYEWGHEFGHTRQNRILGPFYIVIMVASVVSIMNNWKGKHNHHTYWTETWADKLGIEEWERRNKIS
ncbi:MAG: hypothetical protein KDK36_05160 [Leptospiraceae bacterium]|nr:hypothetical protein [Leptospiraceae bacterium]